jgi:hypothetical protein
VVIVDADAADPRRTMAASPGRRSLAESQSDRGHRHPGSTSAIRARGTARAVTHTAEVATKAIALPDRTPAPSVPPTWTRARKSGAVVAVPLASSGAVATVLEP